MCGCMNEKFGEVGKAKADFLRPSGKTRMNANRIRDGEAMVKLLKILRNTL